MQQNTRRALRIAVRLVLVQWAVLAVAISLFSFVYARHYGLSRDVILKESILQPRFLMIYALPPLQIGGIVLIACLHNYLYDRAAKKMRGK